MTAGQFFILLGDIDETKIAEAERQTSGRSRWRRWAALAACLALVLAGTWTALRHLPPAVPNGGGGSPGGGIFGGGDSTLLALHREDFSSELEPAAQSLGPEALKVYRMLTNDWFLSGELTDFSQAVTTQVQYLLPGEQTAGTGEKGPGYTIYTVDETGQLNQSGSVMGSADSDLPHGLVGLTHSVILEDIGDAPYDDYIVTVSHRLYTAFVWVRAAQGDFLLTYPARPEFTGLENRGRYTLEEVQDALTRQYREEQSVGEPNGAWPEGIDPIMASVAVFPKDTFTIYDVEDAATIELTEEEALRFEPLGSYLPAQLPEGWSFDHAMLYDTTMRDGTRFYMLRVVYFRPNGLTEPSILDGETGEELGGGPDGDHFVLFPTNYNPGAEYKVFDADKITVRDVEKKTGSTFHVSYGDICMGISPNNHVDAVDILAIIQANLKQSAP